MVVLSGAFLSGCNQLPSTARPADASGLVLSVPVPDGISSKFTLISPTILYRAASGSDVVSGSVSLSQLASSAGPLNIYLPHDGQWMVSAEWLVNGNPAYIGADLASVTGNTPFALELGNLNSNCYGVSIANPGSNAGFPDTFNFDNDASAYSGVTLTPPADIQCLYYFDPSPLPVLPSSVYLQAYPAAKLNVAYLGNGNWVDFTDIPIGTIFYNDSLTAKRAVLGAMAVMAVNDVYAVKLSATNTAWIQVQTVVNTGATYVQFLYRLNRHSYPYLKFDVTAYGDANCNTSGASLY